MLVGILSDSHGRHLRVRRAMSLFREAGVRQVIHCGDVGGGDVFEEVVGIPFAFVWGNTDDAWGGLSTYVEGLGLAVPHEVPTRLSLDGKTFAVFHGHEPGFGTAEASLDVDYLLHGHSHEARDDRRGGTRIINPGALHRAREKTVAILDTETDDLQFLAVDG